MSDTDAQPEAAGLGDNHPPPAEGNDTQQTDESREAFAQRMASKFGWRPREEFKKAPEEWVDAETFLEKSSEVTKTLRKSLEVTRQSAERAIEQNKRRAIEQAKAELRRAAQSGDEDAIEQATVKYEEAQAGPPPEVSSWQRENPWFETNPGAKAVAIEAAEKVASVGGTVAEQLATARREVQKRYPELFDEEPAPKAAKAPVVAGGQRAASTAPRKRGWNELPADVRASITPKVLKSFSQTQDEYAEAYWKEYG